MQYGTSPLTESHLSASSIDPRPTCLIGGASPHKREQIRLQALEQLQLLSPKRIPVFEEAAQTVSRLLAVPVCLLSVLDQQTQHFKAAIGLSSMGLMNQLASARELPRSESFCTHVVESAQTLVLDDTTQHPAFSKSLLVQRYGIQAYLGVPLLTSQGVCIGTLSIMDLMPRKFTSQEIAILELNARWGMSEYEKFDLIAQLQQTGHSNLSAIGSQPSNQSSLANQAQSKISEVRLGLISQLTQDLRNPLTAITGMASMLSREIYGPLTTKQQEYAKIVLDSSQNLLGLVDEIIELGSIQEAYQQLSFAPVDIEMLAQQSLQPLEKLTEQQDLKLNLTVEPGSRIWVLDKQVVKQLLYHLVFSIVQLSTTGSTVRVHISRKDERLNVAVWVSNPWLGEDLPQTVITLANKQLSEISNQELTGIVERDSGFGTSEFLSDTEDVNDSKQGISRQELGLLLSRHLTKVHQGTINLQGSLETGYRYVVSLPSFEAS